MSLNQHISQKDAARVLVEAWCTGKQLTTEQINAMYGAGLIEPIGSGWQLSYYGGMVKSNVKFNIEKIGD